MRLTGNAARLIKRTLTDGKGSINIEVTSESQPINYHRVADELTG